MACKKVQQIIVARNHKVEIAIIIKVLGSHIHRIAAGSVSADSRGRGKSQAACLPVVMDIIIAAACNEVTVAVIIVVCNCQPPDVGPWLVEQLLLRPKSSIAIARYHDNPRRVIAGNYEVPVA